MIVILLLLLAVQAPAAAPSASAPDGVQKPSNDYIVGPQDVLKVTVFGVPELTRDVTVDTDGTFDFPLVGRIKASGLTVRAVETELKSRLSNGYLVNPTINVDVGAYRSQTVYILGEVREPGRKMLAGNASIMAPLFWAPMFVDSPERLARLLWILLICCGVNSLVGVLQVYDPGRWMPREFSRFITENADMGLGPMSYIGAHGERLIRPPGLFDTPGAVAGPGMSAALLGLVFATSGIALWKRGLSLALALAGFAAIYLSQVRISLVIAAVMLGVYASVTFRQKRFARVTQFGLLAGGTIVGAFVLALTLGGPSIQERVMRQRPRRPRAARRRAAGETPQRRHRRDGARLPGPRGSRRLRRACRESVVRQPMGGSGALRRIDREHADRNPGDCDDVRTRRRGDSVRTWPAAADRNGVAWLRPSPWPALPTPSPS